MELHESDPSQSAVVLLIKMKVFCTAVRPIGPWLRNLTASLMTSTSSNITPLICTGDNGPFHHPPLRRIRKWIRGETATCLLCQLVDVISKGKESQWAPATFAGMVTSTSLPPGAGRGAPSTSHKNAVYASTLASCRGSGGRRRVPSEGLSALFSDTKLPAAARRSPVALLGDNMQSTYLSP